MSGWGGEGGAEDPEAEAPVFHHQEELVLLLSATSLSWRKKELSAAS